MNGRNSNIHSGVQRNIPRTSSTGNAQSSRSHQSQHSTSSQKMPSPRSSPALRPQSPLSPRYDSPGRFEMLQPPSPRAVHNRATGNSQRRANTNSLKLPSLPRFHPANFPSNHSSVQTTPDASSSGSPQAPLSPRAHQRVVSDAQRHLMAYQREMINRAQSPSRAEKPNSPRLEPLGSPGPVTPLELEGDGGYLLAGSRAAAGEKDDFVDKLIREEARRRRRSNSPARPASNR